MSDRVTFPLNRAEIGPSLTEALAFIWLSEVFSRLSQPGMLAFSTSGSFSAFHTIWRGAGMRRSPVISIQHTPVARGGRYLQGAAHATDRPPMAMNGATEQLFLALPFLGLLLSIALLPGL